VPRTAALLIILCASLAALSCNRREARPARPHAEAAGAFGKASLRGKITFHGVPPPPVSRPTRSSFPDCSRLPAPLGDPTLRITDAGEVGEAFVWVKEGLPPTDYSVPDAPITVDQHDCEFTPRVFGIQVDQPLVIVNSDPLLHNVHTPRGFNLPMPRQGMQATKTFNQPGVMTALVCDVHGWMRAYAGVVPHPFFAVTALDGGYTIARLPPGHYTVEAWQERLGRQSREVVVANDDQAVSLDFDMTPN
jgi:hypothetical protein